MAIRTTRSHAGAVREMRGALQFLPDIVAHLMAGDAEFLRIGQLERGVEGAPEHHAADEAAERQKSQTEIGAGPADQAPAPQERVFQPCPDAAHPPVLIVSVSRRAACPGKYSEPVAA